MAELVPIPWQPTLYLRPETLALLVAASARVGTQLRVMAPDGAWRSYARQKYYYDLYKAGKGNPAANPDNPNVQNNHRRGAAFDLVRTDKAVAAACSAVGLIRDAAETWHWNHPYAYRFAVIDNFSSTAGNGSTIITNPTTRTDDDEMLSNEAQAYIDQRFNEMAGRIDAAIRLIKGADNSGETSLTIRQLRDDLAYRDANGYHVPDGDREDIANRTAGKLDK